MIQVNTYWNVHELYVYIVMNCHVKYLKTFIKGPNIFFWRAGFDQRGNIHLPLI